MIIRKIDKNRGKYIAKCDICLMAIYDLFKILLKKLLLFGMIQFKSIQNEIKINATVSSFIKKVFKS